MANKSNKNIGISKNIQKIQINDKIKRENDENKNDKITNDINKNILCEKKEKIHDYYCKCNRCNTVEIFCYNGDFFDVTKFIEGYDTKYGYWISTTCEELGKIQEKYRGLEEKIYFRSIQDKTYTENDNDLLVKSSDITYKYYDKYTGKIKYSK